MSDEPKRHTRAWFLWALIGLVVLAYALSLGLGGSRVLLSTADFKEAPAKLSGIYAPLGWLCEHSDFARYAVLRYMFWWST